MIVTSDSPHKAAESQDQQQFKNQTTASMPFTPCKHIGLSPFSTIYVTWTAFYSGGVVLY